MNATLQSLLSEIRSYAGQHAELQLAHHFMFALHLHPQQRVKFFVMGINPGESDKDWVISPTRTEETCEYDFHEEVGNGRDNVPWTGICKRTLKTDEILLAEIFLWSSPNMVEFRNRYGRLKGNPHLPFCTAMNKQLLEIYSPAAVICPGLESLNVAESEYGLVDSGMPITRNVRGNRLVVVRTDGVRPWIFTKHWSGARMAKVERAQIERVIAEVTRKGPA